MIGSIINLIKCTKIYSKLVECLRSLKLSFILCTSLRMRKKASLEIIAFCYFIESINFEIY